MTDYHDLESLANENRSQVERTTESYRRQIRYLDDEKFRLSEALKDVADLVRWLALKYEARNPKFPETDPMSGQALPGNARLSRAWYRWVRGGTKCTACDGAGFFVHETDDPDVGTLTYCEPCGGRGWIEGGDAREQETSGIDPEATTER